MWVQSNEVQQPHCDRESGGDMLRMTDPTTEGPEPALDCSPMNFWLHGGNKLLIG